MISQKELDHVVSLLRTGKLVAIPTETVYGLAADAMNEFAVKKIFEIKGRPTTHPLIVHLSRRASLSEWARDIPDFASRLVDRFWPGPLTLILKKSDKVLDMVTGQQDTVALRCPQHPITQAILDRFSGGLAAPSANRFGHISPTRAEHVREELGKQVDWIVDGGACSIGVESTILDLTSDKPRIVRPGYVTPKMISDVLGISVSITSHSNIKVSGCLLSHYAPQTPSVLMDYTKLIIWIKKSLSKKIGVLSKHSPSFALPDSISWFVLSDDPLEYAQQLYEKMRQLDASHKDIIVIESVPQSEEWAAVSDRLQKATYIGNRIEEALSK